MSTEVMGIMSMMKEWGISKSARVFADSSAALGVVHRRGSGKLRHVRVSMLWVQEVRASGEMKFEKVEGTMNPADLMTKNLCAKTMLNHSSTLGVEIREGRADASLLTG